MSFVSIFNFSSYFFFLFFFIILIVGHRNLTDRGVNYNIIVIYSFYIFLRKRKNKIEKGTI